MSFRSRKFFFCFFCFSKCPSPFSLVFLPWVPESPCLFYLTQRCQAIPLHSLRKPVFQSEVPISPVPSRLKVPTAVPPSPCYHLMTSIPAFRRKIRYRRRGDDWAEKPHCKVFSSNPTGGRLGSLVRAAPVRGKGAGP